jgi:hypothetical protein
MLNSAIALATAFVTGFSVFPLVPAFYPGHWLKKDAKAYAEKNQLPKFVTDTIEAVWQKRPATQFVVHYFEKDPFLEAVDGRERYFIEAWDEPSYNAQRLA